MTNTTITIGNVRIGNDLPFALISGPCQAESVQHSVDIAGTLAELCAARTPHYAMADLTVDARADYSIPDMAGKVIDALLTRPDVLEAV